MTTTPSSFYQGLPRANSPASRNVSMSAGMRAMVGARTQLVLEFPFFGALSLRLDLVEDPSCGTGWTDGKSLGFDPEFVLSCSVTRRVAFIAHEVLHVALGHPWRRGGRDLEQFNAAADYAINGDLQAGKFDIGPEWHLDSRYTGKGAEWIYDRLPAPQKKQPDPNGPPDPNAKPGQGKPDPNAPAGDVRDVPAGPDAPTEAEWKQAVQQAAIIAKMQGKDSGAAKRFFERARLPEVDWRSVLHRFMTSVASADYTWKRPNRRYLAQGLYLPALHSEKLGRIIVAVDTSGSVDDVLLAQFGAEINAIVSELQPERVDVIYCDAQINARQTFEPGDDVRLRAVGGGGTAFEPVFAAVAKEDEEPACLIYLTDLKGPAPRTIPDYPVLWGCTERGNVGWFGETVYIGG